MKELLKQIEQAQSYTAVKKIISKSFPTTRKRKGSARIVIPINDQYVLKVAYNEKGISQNLNEYRVYKDMPVYYKRFLAQVKKADAINGTWLIQKRVSGIKKRNDNYEVLDASPKLERYLVDCFEVIRGDCDQFGLIGKRKVLFDYGLTSSEYHRLY